MTFQEAIKKLNIEDYGERIFKSNSHGELLHLVDYIVLAENLRDDFPFREWFIDVVDQTKKKWKRPESVYQHILTIFKQHAGQS